MRIGYLHQWANETREDTNQLVQRLKDAECDKVIVIEKGFPLKADFPLEPIKDFFQEGDMLVTTRLNRISFSFDQLVSFCRWLKSKNIELQTLDEEVYGGDAIEFDLYHVMERLVVFQKEARRESTLIGLAAARAKGKLGGRPKGLSEKANQKAEIAVQLYNNRSMSINEICKHLSISKNTLYNYLRKKGVKIGKG